MRVGRAGVRQPSLRWRPCLPGRTRAARQRRHSGGIARLRAGGNCPNVGGVAYSSGDVFPADSRIIAWFRSMPEQGHSAAGDLGSAYWTVRCGQRSRGRVSVSQGAEKGSAGAVLLGGAYTVVLGLAGRCQAAGGAQAAGKSKWMPEPLGARYARAGRARHQTSLDLVCRAANAARLAKRISAVPEMARVAATRSHEVGKDPSGCCAHPDRIARERTNLFRSDGG